MFCFFFFNVSIHAARAQWCWWYKLGIHTHISLYYSGAVFSFWSHFVSRTSSKLMFTATAFDKWLSDGRTHAEQNKTLKLSHNAGDKLREKLKSYVHCVRIPSTHPFSVLGKFNLSSFFDMWKKLFIALKTTQLSAVSYKYFRKR